MEESAQYLIERARRHIEQDTSRWAKSLEAAASVMGEHSARAANEFVYAAKSWRARGRKAAEILQGATSLRLEQIDMLLELIPPNRSAIRFDLERTTQEYDSVVLSQGNEIATSLVRGEVACDQGNHEMGMQILERLSKQAPHYFPVLLLLGQYYMRIRGEANEAAHLLIRATSHPPEIENNRYKALALELLAHADGRSAKPVNAILSLKQALRLEPGSPAISYKIARNEAAMGKKAKTARVLETAVGEYSIYLALAMVDPEFAKTKKTLINVLDEKNDEWGERTVKCFDNVEAIGKIAKKDNLHEDDEQIADGLKRLERVEEGIENGCFSRYVDIITQDIPVLADNFSRRVLERYDERIEKKRTEIKEFNDRLRVRVISQRNLFTRVGLPSWSLLCILFAAVAFKSGATPIISIGLGAGLALFGLVSIMYLDNQLSQNIQSKQRSMNEVQETENVKLEAEKYIEDLRKLLKPSFSTSGSITQAKV